MPTPDFLRVKAILAQARELPPERRGSYLDEACGGEPELRAEVEALLAHDVNPPSILATGAGLAALERTPGAADDTLPPSIGPYRILAVLGEGGMGTVYRAEQTEPIRREVALKLVRRGLDTDRIVARFMAERQALARMDHPHIARVLDAGASADGRPYFVMELVAGTPITQFCDERRLSTAVRLELFLAVCAGVQHAHQKGIIHRDLKPSNILLREQDGVSVPKIIDFGIAKAIGQDGEASSLLTQAGHVVGTPEYMSPEQAGAIDAGVDTRADVYSLGVVLYELLTGRRPYEFRAYTPSEILRVLETEPVRPSLAVTQPGTPADKDSQDKSLADSIGTARATSVSKLRRLLAGDLDNIVLKAMARGPQDRYASVEQLADDVRRHLDGRPVLARTPTWRYRSSRFVRRHRMGVGVAATVAMLLVGFTAAMAIQSARIARERDRAVDAEQRARTEATTAARVSEFIGDLFELSDPSEARGNTVTAREILDRGAERVRTELAGEPHVRAALIDTIGRVYQNLGLYDAATPLLDEALKERRALFGEAHADVGESLDHVARLIRDRGDNAAAEPLYREALAIKRAALGPEHASIALTMNNLANALRIKGEYEEAETLARGALEMRRKLLGPEHADVAESLHDLGGVLRDKGEPEEAERFVREALALDRRLHGNVHPVVAIGLNSLGNLLGERGGYEGAESAYRESLAVVEQLYGRDHVNAAHVKVNLGAFLALRGDSKDAEPLLVESLAIHRAALGEENQWVQRGLLHLGVVRRDQGRFEEAESLLRANLAMSRKLYGEAHSRTAGALSALGSLRERQRQTVEAESLYREALAIGRKALGSEHIFVAEDLFRLGGLLRSGERLDEAEAHLREALQIQRSRLPPQHPDTASTLLGLGELLAARGDATAAEPLLREAVEIRRARLRAGHAEIVAAERALEGVLAAR